MLSLKEKLKEQLSIDSDVKVVRSIEKLLSYAVNLEAAEISFEPEAEKLAVFFRSEGEIKHKLVIPKKFESAIITSLKKMAGLDRSGKNISKGKFKKKYQGGKIVFSLQLYPTVSGERMVIDLHRENFELVGFSRLGLSGKALADVKNSLAEKDGLLLVVGDSSSGRTTTLYSLLSQINKPELNVATVESHIAQDLPGVNQSCLDPLSGYDSAAAVNCLRRQDADVIMITELSDKVTAAAAMRLAGAGHFVLAGAPSRDISATLKTFQDFGVNLSLFSAGANLVITQRLVEKNCPYCLAKQRIGSNDWGRLKLKLGLPKLFARLKQEKIIAEKVQKPEDLTFYKSQGCPRCKNSGIAGKIGIFEVLQVTPEVKKLIKTGHLTAMNNELKNQGGNSLAEDAFIKALSGTIAIKEVFKVIDKV
jgi:type II secretory ATPase GspE/PulE/Tfp pilus assembly ATPase PilB-like protein